MATVAQDNTDDTTNGTPNSNSPTNISGVGASAPTGAQNSSGVKNNSVAPSGDAAQPGTKSGSFTNLQNYLNANSGANLGGTLYNSLNDQAQNLQNQQDTASQNWQNQNAAQSDVKYNSNTVNNAINNPSQYVYGSDTATTSNTPNSSNLNAWNAQYNAANNFNPSSFSPNGFDANATALNNNNNFAQTASLVNSEPGQQQLLQKLYANPGYSTGQQSLDNLLLEGNPNQLAQLQQAPTLASNLTNDYNNQINNNANAITQWGQDAQNAQTQTRAALTGAENTAETGLTNAANTQQANNVAAYQSLINNMGDNALTSQQAQALGLTKGEHVWNVLNNAGNQASIVQQAPEANIYNTANAQDYAKFQALAQLAGQPTSTFLPGTDASQAGTANTAGYTTQNNVLQSLLGKASGDYQNAYNNINSAQPQTQIPFENMTNQNQTFNNALAQAQQAQTYALQQQSGYGNVVGGPQINTPSALGDLGVSRTTQAPIITPSTNPNANGLTNAQMAAIQSMLSKVQGSYV